jgi:hypothetical protein
MIGLLISLIIWGLIFAIVWWGISQIPVPEPFSWVIRVIFVLLVVLVLLDLLTGSHYVGLPAVHLPS